jgi:hypothetical protein
VKIWTASSSENFILIYQIELRDIRLYHHQRSILTAGALCIIYFFSSVLNLSLGFVCLSFVGRDISTAIWISVFCYLEWKFSFLLKCIVSCFDLLCGASCNSKNCYFCNFISTVILIRVGSIYCKMDLREIGGMVWTGSNWLRIGTSGGLLWTRWWNFGFLKITGNFLNRCTIGSFSGRAHLRK